MLARIFVVLGGLFVLALTAALVGPYFIDWTNYRADFEREAGVVLGRKVKVNGDASARLLPFPSVTFNDVVVGEPDHPVMTAESFSMDAELAPLASGEFRIFDMRLVQPKAIVTVGDDGIIDWAVRPSTPFAATHTSLEKLTITDGEVTIDHAAGGRKHSITGINAEASARSFAGPWRADGTLIADGQPASLSISTGVAGDDGAMRLRLTARPVNVPFAVESDGDVKMVDGAATYAGTFRVVAQEDIREQLRGASGAAAKADREVLPPNRLSGSFTFDDKALSVDAFRFETGPLDDPYVADGKASVDIGKDPHFEIVADGAQVRLDEKEENGRVSAFTLEQRLAALQETLRGLPKPTIPGKVDINLPAIVAGDTTVRDIRVSAEPQADGWSVKSLSAVLPGRATVEAEGLLATSGELAFKGHLLLAVAQPSGFMAWLSANVDDAIRRLPRAGFSADVEFTRTQQAFTNLEMQLGTSTFKGSLTSRRGDGVRPSMQVTLDGGALDLDGLSALGALFVDQTGGNRLNGTDLDIGLKAGPVTVAGVTTDKLDTALRLRGTDIEVDRMLLEGLAGASVSGTGRLKDFPQKPVGNLDASIVAVDLQPVLDLFANRLPNLPGLQQLRERGAAHTGLYSDAEINVVASGARASGPATYTVNATGTAGGTTFDAKLSGSPDDASVARSVTLSAKNGDATQLMSLVGVQTLPLGLTGAGSMQLSVEGILADGMKTTAAFAGDDAMASFEGMLMRGEEGLSIKGAATLQAADIEPWMMTAGLGLPGMGTGTSIDLKADADFGNSLLVLSDLTGTVADGSVAGDINVEAKAGLPHLSGQVALDEFDLYPFAKLILGNDSVESANDGWATAAFARNSVAPFSADMMVNTGSFAAGPMGSASDAAMSVHVDGEGMRVTDIDGNFADGKISGLIELKNNDGTGLFSAQLKLTNADLALLGDGLKVGGRGDFSTALSASGKSMESIVASLSGSGTATMRDLRIDGLNPGAFAAIVAEADRIGRDVDAPKTAAFAPALVNAATFEAGNADVAFTVAGGVLRAPALTLPRPAATLTAETGIDVNTGAVNVKGSIAYAPGDQALVGSEPTVDFTVSGPIGDAALTLDTAPLAQFLTQRALEAEQARVEAMQADLLEKQRLRREVRYYAALQTERDRIAEEKRKAEEEARRKAEEEARIAAEVEAAKRAQEEQQRLEQERQRSQENAPAPQPKPETPAQQPFRMPSLDDSFDTTPARPPTLGTQ